MASLIKRSTLAGRYYMNEHSLNGEHQQTLNSRRTLLFKGAVNRWRASGTSVDQTWVGTVGTVHTAGAVGTVGIVGVVGTVGAAVTAGTVGTVWTDAGDLTANP